jgi:hypothetical protein
MKNTIRILMLTLVINSCTQEDILNLQRANPPKFKTVNLIRNSDTTTYTFGYNSDTTKLTSVLRNGLFYASIGYSSNTVMLAMKMNNTYNDTFVANITSDNFLDSLNFFSLPNTLNSNYKKPVRISRNSNNKLSQSTNFLIDYLKKDGFLVGYDKLQTNTFNMVYNSSNNNLIKYNTQAIQGILDTTYRDSIVYNTSRTNQPNLPDQFSTNLQSYFLQQGKPILTPLFLLQQSNIFPYQIHTNLIDSWLMYDIDFNGFPTINTEYFYRYSYTFDANARVTQMDITVNGANYLSYQFIYFN